MKKTKFMGKSLLENNFTCQYTLSIHILNTFRGGSKSYYSLQSNSWFFVIQLIHPKLEAAESFLQE